jgi:HSP20 family protein
MNRISLPRAFGSLFDDPFFAGLEDSWIQSWVPAVEVSEDDKGLTLTVEVPGLEEKNLKVSVENGILTLSGERAEENTDDSSWKRSERRYGKFSRSFRLPETADVENISAQLKHGVLTLSVPKMEDARRRQIEVKVN